MNIHEEVDESQREDSSLLSSSSAQDQVEETPDEHSSSAQDQVEETPDEHSSDLPWKQLIPLCLIQLCDTFSSSGIFAYGAFLVKDFTGQSIDKAGFWAGFLPSAAYAGMFLGGLPWGYLSDRWGKRICLLLGSIGSIVSAIGLGMSTNLGMAIAFRFASGVLNGNLGIVKSFLGAISNENNQGKAFGLIAIVWGAGAFLGSAIGGFLARPVVQYPGIFSSSGLFGTFPYLLPNLVNASLMMISLVLGFFFLKEPKVADNKVDVVYPSVWKQRNALLAVSAYICVGFSFILFEECIPLFLASTRGLSFTTAEIGMFQSAMGLILLGTTSLYHHVPKRVGGYIRTYRLGTLLGVPLCLLTPFLSFMADSVVFLKWMGLIVFATSWCFVDNFSFASVMVLVANSTRRAQLGVVNGIGQSGVALVRAIGPVIGGSIFAASLLWDSPIAIWAAFAFQALCMIAVFGLSMFLPACLEKPFVEEEKPVEEMEMQPKI